MESSNVLSTRAMLAIVNISMWSARKTDKRVTREVLSSHHAHEDAGKWNKSLVAKEALAAITEAAGAARRAHGEMTLPWLDKDGARILPAAGYVIYAGKLRAARETFEEAARAFVDAYPSFVEQARRDLNGTFDATDYPTADEIAAKFAFKTRILPMPDAADFRVQLGDEDTAILRADIESASREALAGAMRDAWERIADAVGRMVLRLNGYSERVARNAELPDGKREKGAKGTFTSTLVDNIRDLVKLLPILNIAADPRLADIAKRMESDLCMYDADDLREDDHARATTAKAAAAILADVSSFLA